MKQTKERGQFGYLKDKRRFYLMMTAIWASILVIQIVIGIAIWHTTKNLMMITAMLSVIPMANYLVVYVAIAMFDGGTREQYEALAAYHETDMLLCDLVIVDEKGGRNPLDFCVVYKNGIVGYQSYKKDTKDMIEVTLNTTLKRRGIPMRIKVYRDWNEFVERLSDVELAGDDESRKRVERGKKAMLDSAM